MMKNLTLAIEKFKKGNSSLAQISRETGIPKSTLGFYFKKYKALVPFSELKKRGRPSKLSRAFNTRIGQLIKRKTFITAREIADVAEMEEQVKVSPRTIRRRVVSLGYKHAKPKSKIVLLPRHIYQRKLFLSKYGNLDFKSVIFSDESTFQLNANNTRVWQKSDNPVFIPKIKFPTKLMVWGAISYEKKSKLYFVDGSMNADQYIQVMKEYLLPFKRLHRNRSMKFQQDNAPCHTAKLTAKFFRERKVEYLTWPANSPDLNLIETVWGWMKPMVSKKKPKTKEELKTAILNAWDDIKQESIQKLYHDMGVRLAELKASRGGYTSF